MMTDPNTNQPRPAGEPKQPGQMSTADIASAASRPAAPDGGQGVPQGRPAVNNVPARAGDASGPAPLLPANEIQDLRAKWTDIQAGFVDKPREAVEGADAMVASVMQRLAETFANERSKLETQWSHGDNASTEDLRVALQHYRSFFDRLLSL